MSMESLGALRQLVQVREQNATIQNDNLEKVQSSVQQVSVAESQRVDQLNLEKAKAQYEVALAAATVERIQSQLDRETKAVAVTQLATYITAGLAAADSFMNMKKDFQGGQKLGDSNAKSATDGLEKGKAKVINGNIEDNNLYIGASDGSKKKDELNVEVFGNGAVNVDNAIKAGLLTKNVHGELFSTDKGKRAGIDVSDEGKVTYSGDKAKSLNYIDEDKAIKHGLVLKDSEGNLSTTDKGKYYGINIGQGVGEDGKARNNVINYDKSKGDSLSFNSETIYRASTAGNTNNVAYFTAATISQEDIKMKAEQLKKNDPKFKDLDVSKVNSFEDLYKVDKKSAEDLFNENGHDIKGVEADNAKTSFSGALEEFKGKGDVGKDNRIKELNGSLENKLKKDGKSDGIGFMEGGKYVVNGLISFAETVVPQFQALMAAKDRVEKTAIELAAAMEKLAAAEKKLKQIEDLIVSVGGDNLGNGNNQVEKGLS